MKIEYINKIVYLRIENIKFDFSLVVFNYGDVFYRR